MIEKWDNFYFTLGYFNNIGQGSSEQGFNSIDGQDYNPQGFSASDLEGFPSRSYFGHFFPTRQPQIDSSDPCTAPKSPGSCQALYMRYYYNPASKTCESFAYGG